MTDLVEVAPPVFSSHLYQTDEENEEEEDEEARVNENNQQEEEAAQTGDELPDSADKVIPLNQTDFEETLTGNSSELASNNKGRKYATEEPHHENWPKHKKHVFILSSAGKPIYSRYGDESSLAGFVGVIQAIISFVADDDDTIRYVVAGKLKVVFVIKGPIYLVSVSKTDEPVSQLMQQLTYMHSQIISILTAGTLTKIFNHRAQYDIRNLLGGTERFLDSLMSWMDRDHSIMMNGIHCLRLNNQQRNLIGSIMHNARVSNLLYAILIAKNQLVNWVAPRKHGLHPVDLHLILNFVNTCTAFRTSETWTPLCLPRFDDSGFLHAYVCFIATDICLILISTKPEEFFHMSECRNSIVKLFNSGEPSVFQTLENALKNQYYDISEVEVPGLLHFVYKTLGINQITCPTLGPPYTNRREKKRLFRMYQHVHARATQTQPPHKVYYHSSSKETVLAWITGGFQLYATFGPLETISNVISGCNSLLQWIKKEETKIFVLDSPVFN